MEPRHPTAGGLSIEDINRRLTQQIQELKLDERLVQSREVLNKHLATGHKKVSTAFNHLWADIETLREAQRRRQADARAKDLPFSTASANPLSPLGHGGLSSPSTPGSDAGLLPSPSRFSYDAEGKSPTPARGFDATSFRARAPDLSHAQAAVGAAGMKAGAYLSSWGAWATERRRGWAKGAAASSGNGGGYTWGEGEDGSGGGGAGFDAGSGASTGAEKAATGAGGKGVEGSGQGVGAARRSQAVEEKRAEGEDKDTVSPMVSSPRKAVGRKRSSREIIGGDGIGRLDA